MSEITDKELINQLRAQIDLVNATMALAKSRGTELIVEYSDGKVANLQLDSPTITLYEARLRL